ncbi:MAG: Mur ligase family protein, partial [Parvularculaceae bacterium]
IVTTVAPAHLEFFKSIEKIAEAKAEIFLGVVKGGAAILPRDNPHFDLLKRRAAEAGVKKIISFGEHAQADVRLASYNASEAAGEIRASVFGEDHDFRLGAPGRHQAMNSLAVLAAVHALDGDVAKAATALTAFAPGEGRGARRDIALPGGGSIVLIDESYNANPVSMAAAIALLGAAKPKRGGRRIAVLGDMLELGPEGPALHESLAGPLAAAKIDKLYVAGDFMRRLWEKAPAAMRAKAALTASALVADVVGGLRDGDIVMVKGSNASKVSEIARALGSLTSGAPRAKAGGA